MFTTYAERIYAASTYLLDNTSYACKGLQLSIDFTYLCQTHPERGGHI